MATNGQIPPAFGVLLLTASVVSAKVEVADILGSEMILQRDVPVPVWGKADPGEAVTVGFAGQTKSAAAGKYGRWLVRLDPLRASDQPRSLTIRSSGNTIELDNVRVGEVWLVLSSGFTRLYSTESPAPYPSNRVIDLGGDRQYSTRPRETYGRNRRWRPRDWSRYSPMSCQFANRLHERLNVPVGIVRVHVENVEAATPPQGFAEVPQLKDIADRVGRWDPSSRRGRQAYGQRLAQIRRWAAGLRRDLASGEAIAPSQPPRIPGPAPDDRAQPTVRFNHGIHPIVPLAFRGVIHAHASADAEDVRYTAKMLALIRGLRAAFGRGDMAFCLLQQDNPNLYYLDALGDEFDLDAWAGHRDRQRCVAAERNTGLIVTADVDAHPVEVGRRIARWALTDIHGAGGNRPSMGPLYKACRVRGNKVIVEFDHAGSGLMAAAGQLGKRPIEREDGRLKYFAVAGSDRVWRRAEARIEGTRIVAWSGKVAEPVAVRYAFQTAPRAMNLYNRDGLPASPFRSDDWPIQDPNTLFQQFRSRSVGELVGLLGYPGDAGALAAARALAAHGKGKALPVVHKLLTDGDGDLRCGGLRALGYLYWLGAVRKDRSGYRDVAPQTLTPELQGVIGRICAMAGDKDLWARTSVAQALGLIGAQNETVCKTLERLAGDEEPLVRCAALQAVKFRIKRGDYFAAAANAALSIPRPNDHRSAESAALLYSSCYRSTGLDMKVLLDYLQRQDIGTCGPGLNVLGTILARMRILRSEENRPEFLPAFLKLYSIGCRGWVRYGGVERFLGRKENHPAVKKKIAELQGEIARLGREGAAGWLDRRRRYADAIAGLTELIDGSP